MTNGARGWILWVALAIMCADSLVSLVPVIYEVIVNFLKNRASLDEDQEAESAERLVPPRWVILGISASILVGTVLVWVVFGANGIKPWATIIGFGGCLLYVSERRFTIASHGCPFECLRVSRSVLVCKLVVHSNDAQCASFGRDRPQPS